MGIEYYYPGVFELSTIWDEKSNKELNKTVKHYSENQFEEVGPIRHHETKEQLL